MKASLRTIRDGDVTYNALAFVCPACGNDLHMLPVNTTEKSPAWDWDGNLEAPTLSPSILTRWGRNPNERVCHSYLRAGVFEYLGDCTHRFAGRHIPLPDLPAWFVAEFTDEEEDDEMNKEWRESVDARLDEVLYILRKLYYKENEIIMDLTQLTTDVQSTTDVEQSAVTLIQGLSAQLAAAIASNDPNQLTALQSQLESGATALAAAVAANTTPAPPVDGGSTSPADGDQTPPPADGGTPAPPADGDQTPPPADGDQTPPPVDTGSPVPPADTTTAGGGTPVPPVDSGSTDSGAGSMDTTSGNAPAVTLVPNVNLPAYVYSGDGTPPPSDDAWTQVPGYVFNGAPVYTFAGDTPGVATANATSPTWTPVTGTLVVPPAATQSDAVPTGDVASS